jgi:hypothetical protein
MTSNRFPNSDIETICNEGLQPLVGNKSHIYQNLIPKPCPTEPVEVLVEYLAFEILRCALNDMALPLTSTSSGFLGLSPLGMTSGDVHGLGQAQGSEKPKLL